MLNRIREEEKRWMHTRELAFVIAKVQGGTKANTSAQFMPMAIDKKRSEITQEELKQAYADAELVLRMQKEKRNGSGS